MLGWCGRICVCPARGGLFGYGLCALRCSFVFSGRWRRKNGWMSEALSSRDSGYGSAIGSCRYNLLGDEHPEIPAILVWTKGWLMTHPHRIPRQVEVYTESAHQCGKCPAYVSDWLVVWNMNFSFPNSCDDDPIWLSYFSDETTNSVNVIFIPVNKVNVFLFLSSGH